MRAVPGNRGDQIYRIMFILSTIRSRAIVEGQIALLQKPRFKTDTRIATHHQPLMSICRGVSAGTGDPLLLHERIYNGRNVLAMQLAGIEKGKAVVEDAVFEQQHLLGQRL